MCFAIKVEFFFDLNIFLDDDPMMVRVSAAMMTMVWTITLLDDSVLKTVYMYNMGGPKIPAINLNPKKTTNCKRTTFRRKSEKMTPDCACAKW